MSVDESTTGENAVEYDVVINQEEQYSIWPVGEPVPAGWTAAGFRGTKSQALDHIAGVWTDITPLSVRRASSD